MEPSVAFVRAGAEQAPPAYRRYVELMVEALLILVGDDRRHLASLTANSSYCASNRSNVRLGMPVSSFGSPLRSVGCDVIPAGAWMRTALPYAVKSIFERSSTAPPRDAPLKVSPTRRGRPCL